MPHTPILPVILLIALVVSLLIIARKRKNKSLSTPEEEKQDAKNRECIDQIIDGNYKQILPDEAEASKKAFEKWQAFQKKMFRDAPKEKLKLRSKYIDENKFREFDPDFTDVPSKDDLPQGLVLFIQDAFTEPFPSTHDMDDWALSTQIADVMLLNGITPEESQKFCVHIKNHFVNHDMVCGIIQFDLYKTAA